MRSSASGQAQTAVRRQRPAGVVRDLPRVALGVDDDRAVAAPERLVWLTSDGGARRPRLLGHSIYLIWGSQVQRQGDAAPATAVFNAAVLGQPRAVPQRQDHVTGLEEGHVRVGRGAGLPTQRFVEAACSL